MATASDTGIHCPDDHIPTVLELKQRNKLVLRCPWCGEPVFTL